MIAPKRHFALNLWVKIRILMALLVIMVGVLVGVVSLLLPFDSLYKSRLEDFLRQQWQLDLSIDKVQGEWQGYGPRFRLQNLLLNGEQSVQIDSVDLRVNVFQFLIPGGKSGIELGIEKADLALLHSESGADFTFNQEQQSLELNQTVENLLNKGALRINELTINLRNAQGKVLLSDLKANLLVEQDQTKRGLELDLDQNNGQLAVKAVADKSLQLSQDATWYFSLSQFNLAELNPFLAEIQLPSVVVDGELWLEMRDGELVNASALLDWHSESAELSGNLTLQHSGGRKNWQSLIKLANLRWQDKSQADINLKVQRNAEEMSLSLQALDLAMFKAVAAVVFDSVPEFNLQGRLNNLYLSYHRQQHRWQQIAADFQGLTINSPNLSVHALDGHLELYQRQLNLSVASQAGSLQLPQVFRGSAHWQELLAQLQIPIDNPRQLSLQQFWLDGEHYTIDAQLQWFAGLEEQADYLSMQARTWQVDVSQLNKFWPYLVWDKKVIDWLDNGLHSGVVERGYVVHQGQMVKKAYEKGVASFFSRAYARQVAVKFHPDWPMVKQLDTVAEFSEKGFSAVVNHAQSKQLQFDQSQVAMPSYKQNHIALDLTADSQANGLLDYLRDSPIMQQVELTQEISLGGKQTVKLNVDVPLKGGKNIQPQGTIKLKNSRLNSPHLQLEKLNGTVKVDGYDLLIKHVKGKLFNTPINLNGKIKSRKSQGLDLQLDIAGDFAAQELFADIASPLPADGSSRWNFHLQGEREQLWLNMYSDLTGTAINLPEPLMKTAEQAKPISINCKIPCEQSIISINYNQQLQAVLQTGEKPQLHELWFGAKPTTQNQDNSKQVGGRIAKLDLDAWLSLLNQADAKPSQHLSMPLPSSNFSITVEQLQFMGRYFQQLELNFEKLDDGLQIYINSPAIKGMLTVAEDLDNKGIVADFEYLHWKDAEVEQTEAVNEKIESLPDLHAVVKKFSYNQIDLGSLRLEMRNVAHGLHIEQLSLQSSVGSIQAVGDWYKPKGSSDPTGKSAFDIVIAAESIAEFLKPMGFDAPLSDAQTLVKIKALWDGLPSRFDLKQITGSLDIKIGEGEVLDAEPGFGRVLGLFSLTNLPRRLLFDFRDVMGEGLHFSKMEGHFVLDKGIATTDDFRVKASSASISLTGKTNFILQNYDQTIIIQPQIGKTFPTIGAIAGGAVGAAAGFLVQGLLDKQLKLNNQITYRVTGSWSEPQIEVIEND